MKKLVSSLLAVGMALCISAQDNMEAFRHLSIGAEAGLSGFGVELALPIQKHFVLKAGYNWMPSGDLFNTDITLDSKELKDAQNRVENDKRTSGGDPDFSFAHKFTDETVINAGMHVGLSNFKAMINWYPFVYGRFYLSGGIFYTPASNQDDSFIRLSGNTSENDWAALKELNDNDPQGRNNELALEIGGNKYPVVEKEGCGYMQADFKIDPLKYYFGLGLGRCIPNGRVGLQFEVGAMIYHNSTLYCQNQEVDLKSVGNSFGSDAEEILAYVDKYPIYPQLTLRLSFRVF